MNDYKEIIKWTNYFSRWRIRYYKIEGAMFCYSKQKDFSKKHTAFLGICKIENEDDYLKMSTGSFIWYFKGNTIRETEGFKTLILEGISKGLEILKSHQQNVKYIPDISEITYLNEGEMELINTDAQSLEEILDKKSISTIVDCNNYKIVLKKIESKIKLPNNAFKNYLDSGDYEKEDLNELHNQYKDIEKRLKKVNEFFNNGQI